MKLLSLPLKMYLVYLFINKLSSQQGNRLVASGIPESDLFRIHLHPALKINSFTDFGTKGSIYRRTMYIFLRTNDDAPSVVVNEKLSLLIILYMNFNSFFHEGLRRGLFFLRNLIESVIEVYGLCF